MPGPLANSAYKAATRRPGRQGIKLAHAFCAGSAESKSLSADPRHDDLFDFCGRAHLGSGVEPCILDCSGALRATLGGVVERLS